MKRNGVGVTNVKFKYTKLLIYSISALLFIRILQYSWVTDDAFITFRSVFNLVDGNGPVFNIGERVQSFTHPLWFILLSIGGFLDLNLYFFSILLGLTFSLLTIKTFFCLNQELNANNNTLFLLSLGVLTASESFVQFGTSGLENSLTYFLITTSVIASLDKSRRQCFYLLCSLALLNRFDTIFLLAPLFFWVTYKDLKTHEFKISLLIFGSLPLASWHIFSVIYYGFLFPNTKYAKVGGRPFVENAKSGFNYLFDSMQAEWHVWLFITFLLYVCLLKRHIINEKYKGVLFALVAGIFSQLCYVVFISGGDFMRGRFFTVTALCTAIAMLFLHPPVTRFLKLSILFTCFVLFSISAWLGAKEHLLWMAPGVANERNFYKDTLALNLNPLQNYTNHVWAQQARELSSSPIGIIGVNGQRGYWMPRNINLIDTAALTDAFIARSPIIDNSRTGHFTHKIPEEYFQIKVNKASIPEWKDKKAQALYENINIVTESSAIFSVKRMKSMFWIWKNYGI